MLDQAINYEVWRYHQKRRPEMSDQTVNSVVWRYHQEHYRELLEVVETGRLLKQASGRSNRKVRLFTRIGDILVSSGMRLKKQYEPMVQCNTLLEFGGDQTLYQK